MVCGVRSLCALQVEGKVCKSSASALGTFLGFMSERFGESDVVFAG